MTRVKICGITRVEDALLCVDAGAHALGFIAVPESPRFVTPAAVAAVCAALPPFVSTVVVARTLADAALYPTDTAQVYAEGGDAGGKRIVRVYRIRDAASVEEALGDQGPAAALLLDAWHESALGGTGQPFDWSLAAEAVRRARRPVVLAGGLTPENVSAAVAAVRPYAVDVSSGVESAPGRKDRGRVRAFLQAVHRAP